MPVTKIVTIKGEKIEIIDMEWKNNIFVEVPGNKVIVYSNE